MRFAGIVKSSSDTGMTSVGVVSVIDAVNLMRLPGAMVTLRFGNIGRLSVASLRVWLFVEKSMMGI